MSWLSILTYFAEPSRVAIVYSILTLILLKESFINLKLECMQKMDPAFKCDMNIVCKGRLLFNYSTKLGYYNEGTEEKGREYSDSIINETINLNDFTDDENYFTV